MAVVGEGSILAAMQEGRRDDWSAVQDGIVLVQVKDSGVHWQEPGDLDADGSCTKESATPRIGGSRFGFHVAFLDGEVWRLRPDTPRDLLLTFFTVEGAAEFEREAVLAAYRVE